MSMNEIITVIGGLYIGYIIMTKLMNESEKNTADESKPKENSSSSKDQYKDEQKSNQNTNEKQSTQDDFISKNWFRILETNPSASEAEISIQYKRKIREYHPDKVANLGRELRELAEFKSKEINAAYEFAKRLKG